MVQIEKSKKSEDALTLNQMNLDLFCAEGEGASKTRSLSIYDLAPKFVYEKPLISFLEIEEKKIPTYIVREFQAKGQAFRVVVHGANIIGRDGKPYVAFPSTREEVIETALRKMAISGHGVNYQGNLGVHFSLYALRQELASYGHSTIHSRIERSIEIMRRASLTITNLDTGASWEENIFPQLAKGGWVNNAGEEYQKWFISFHKLVTDNIMRLQYRDMNYPAFMKLPGLLHRYVFLRMVNLYTYAAEDKPYQPTRNQILMESGRGRDGPSAKQTERVNRVLNYLIKDGIIDRWEISEKNREGREVVNVRYDIYPSKRFIHDVIDANKANERRQIKVAKASLRELK